jgi:hypothetical protein
MLKMNEGKLLMITIEIGSKRSPQQNAYYWTCVIPIIQAGFKDLGHDISKEDTHLFLKSRFNYKEIINTTTGEVMKLPDTTTVLNKSQFADYIESIKQFGAEMLNVYIPEPNEQLTIEG